MKIIKVRNIFFYPTSSSALATLNIHTVTGEVNASFFISRGWLSAPHQQKKKNSHIQRHTYIKVDLTSFKQQHTRKLAVTVYCTP